LALRVSPSNKWNLSNGIETKKCHNKSSENILQNNYSVTTLGTDTVHYPAFNMLSNISRCFLYNHHLFLVCYLLYHYLVTLLYFSYIMTTTFGCGRSRSTRREPPTIGKQLELYHLRLSVPCMLSTLSLSCNFIWYKIT
jgi:hypothetical protein